MNIKDVMDLDIGDKSIMIKHYGWAGTSRFSVRAMRTARCAVTAFTRERGLANLGFPRRRICFHRSSCSNSRSRSLS